MKKIKIRTAFITLILPLLFIVIYSCAYSTKASVSLLNKSMDRSYDMVIVPGVPFDGGRWSSIMKARVYWSKYLYDKGIAKNIMYSGSAVYTPFIESEIMALYGEAIGIPKENIYTETKAEHSTENIYYSYKKAKKLGFERIALASDPFQTKMLRKFTYKKLDKNVVMLPMVIDSLKTLQPLMKDPEIDYKKLYIENFTPLPERENFWKRFRGTQGRRIDKNAY